MPNMPEGWQLEGVASTIEDLDRIVSAPLLNLDGIFNPVVIK